MKKILLSTALVASLFASGYEVGAGLGYSDIEKSDRLNNKTDINVRFGKYLPKNHILRLEIERSVAGSGPSLTKALVNVEHYFGEDTIQPYAFVGTGYQWAEGSYSNSIVVDLGAGAKYNIDEKWAAFLEARALRAFENNDNHYSAILGVNYKFGFAPKDSDGDGVIDKNDKCPNTAAGISVDVNGCALDSDNDGVIDAKDKCPATPAGVKVDANGCALDSDNDGVADYLDKCPATPAGVKVDANGCALDSDNDGVADYLDKCPNTPTDVKVNKDGCPLTYNFKITFANNSSKLSPEAQEKVAKFAEFLKENKSVSAAIEGYTDSKGSKKYNIKLSEKRAKAVYNELINLGISADRLSYKGYGPANPIASNDTAEGRLENRRVIAKLTYK
jgi:OOP family OmpA-OmpF porin